MTYLIMAKKKTTEETTSTPATTATPTPVEIEIKPITFDMSKVPFLIDWKEWDPFIVLPGSAFFDQELWEVIYNKLMKTPVKDVQVLLWLSKLWSTINNISKSLVELRDNLAEAVWFDLTVLQWALTPEMLNSEEYQAKSKKFWELLNEYIFNRKICLEPLGSLTLDLTNPDGHAKSFIEWSSLSADDILKLSEAGILIVKSKEDAPAKEGTLAPAKDEQEPESEQKPEPEPDVLVPNENE